MGRIGGGLKAGSPRTGGAGTLPGMGDGAAPASARAAARAFAGGREVVDLAPLGRGLIHATFAARLAGDGADEIVVQQLNTEIFQDPDALMQNLVRITAHLREHAGTPGAATSVLHFRSTDDGALLFRDADGGAWRASDRILGAAPPRDAGPTTLRAAASAFAHYALALDDLPPPRLHVTIPAFHDFAARERRFEAVAREDRRGRGADCADELDALRGAVSRLERALPREQLAGLPQRIAHHDCKLDNLLVDERDGTARCVVDLDTTMPGSWLSDFGELVRSAAARGGEARTDGPAFDLAAFDALAEGYAGVLAHRLTPDEIEALPLAGAHLALMNALRFATDHLEGDVYFRIFEPGQNRARAHAQRRLAEAMLARADELRAHFAAALSR